MYDASRTRGLFVIVALCTGCSVFEEPLPRGKGDDTLTEPNNLEADDAGDNAGDGDGHGNDEGDDDGSDAALPSDDASATRDDGGLGDAGGSEEDAGSTCELPGVNVMDDCTGPIVINEVDGSGEDYIEIYNRGDVPVNISNYIIADDSAGNPDVSEGIIFPAGTVLDPKRFLYLWANLPPEPAPVEGGMLYAECISGTPPPCLHSEWGVSAGGERVYLLNDLLEVVCALNYPNAVFGGEAFGRVPDGADTLCPTNPTAGELNVASSLR